MDLGFKSYKSLSKLTEESCKTLFSRMITPGQYVLLEAGLEMLRPTTGQASSLAPQDPTPTRTAPTEVSVTAQQGPAQDAVSLAALLHGLPPLETTRQDLIAGEVATDPFCFRTCPYSAKKLKLVSDYVTNAQADTTHRNTIMVGGVEVEIAKAKSGTNEKNTHYSLYGGGPPYPPRNDSR